jgi:hypothetical protein
LTGLYQKLSIVQDFVTTPCRLGGKMTRHISNRREADIRFAACRGITTPVGLARAAAH